MNQRSYKRVLVKAAFIILGAAILSFGIHNINERADITEGGVIGLMILINQWFGISPAYVTPVVDLICYAFAFRLLGFSFIKWSVLATGSVSVFYKIWERLPYMLPDMSSHPLMAALIGGAFVGVGVGIIVRMGGSSGGDDALALSISHMTGWRLSRAYLLTDVTVLLLSLTYIPISRIIFSLITVTVSSNLIDLICGRKREIREDVKEGSAETEHS